MMKSTPQQPQPMSLETAQRKKNAYVKKQQTLSMTMGGQQTPEKAEIVTNLYNLMKQGGGNLNTVMMAKNAAVTV